MSQNRTTEILENITTDDLNSIYSSLRSADGRDVFVTTFGQLATSHKDSQITEQFCYGLPGTGVVSEITGSGNIETTDALLRLSTTTADGTAYAESLQSLRYIPGSMAYAFFTVAGLPSQTGCHVFVGIFDDEDGFAVGCRNGVPTVLRRRYNDVGDITTDYISQSEWNLDPLDGTGKSLLDVDFTKGQIYAITYGYLGFAPILFSIKAPNDNWIPFHRIEYPNTATKTNISMPYLPARAEVDNTGSGQAIEIGIGSLDIGVYNGGKTDSSSRSLGLAGSDSDILATPKSFTGTDYIIALRAAQTLGGRVNRISTLLSSLSWDTQDSVKSVTLEVIRDPDVTTAGTWTALRANDSPVEWSIDTVFDLTTGTSTGIGNALAKDDSLSPLNTGALTNTLMRRGEILVFKVTSTNGTVGDIFIGLKDLL